MRRSFFLLICLFCFFFCGLAQKKYQDIRASLKSGTNLAASLRQVDRLRNEGNGSRDPKLLQYGVLLCQRINDGENEKAYLKQKYDTLTFFSSIYGMYDYAFALDSVERRPSVKGKITFKYRKRNVELLKRSYANLYNAVRFFFRKKNYAECSKYAFLALSSARQEMLRDEHSFQDARQCARLAYWAGVSSYESHKDDDFFRMLPLALGDTLNRCRVLEMECEILDRKGFLPGLESILKMGVQEYPEHVYFFSRLTDLYNSQRRFDASLELCEKLQERDTANLLVKYAESVALLNLREYDRCIHLSQQILRLDSLYADAFYNIGACFCNKAAALERRISFKEEKSLMELKDAKTGVIRLYREALPFMEKYRALKPQETRRYGELLYRIYLHLNMEKKFNEMDALLKGQSSGER